MKIVRKGKKGGYKKQSESFSKKKSKKVLKNIFFRPYL